MKNLGLATIAATGLMAAVLGFAGPANADIGHHNWVYDIQPQVSVPHGGHGRSARATDEYIPTRAPGNGCPLFVCLGLR